MSFLNYFFPKRISYPDSKYNKQIVVLDYHGTATLFSEDLIESGSIMTHIWGKGLRQLLPKKFVPQTVLLLGLGGGSNALLVNKKFPLAQITGVDIDPVMVEIGKKHFGLTKVKNLKLVVQDALDFVRDLDPSTHFDLILLDCFVGKKIPLKIESVDFLQNLKDRSRFILINRLWWHEERKDALRFLATLKGKFVYIKTHTWTNTVISLV